MFIVANTECSFRHVIARCDTIRDECGRGVGTGEGAMTTESQPRPGLAEPWRVPLCDARRVGHRTAPAFLIPNLTAPLTLANIMAALSPDGM